MSLLKEETTSKRQVNKLLELEQEFNSGNDKKYKVEVTHNSKVYAKEAVSQLPGFYYLIS